MSVAEEQLTGGRWQARPGLGVYVHIPFCLHRCHYCDFNTYEGQDELHEAYARSLIGHIERTGGGGPASTVFFGGGTPTLLPARVLGRILRSVREAVGLVPGAEVTVEANPETVDEGVFAELLECGFNRVSVGVQSLVPSVLGGLGRTHSPERALDAIRAAKAAGFANVNADLIYGSPWESPDHWVRSLEGVLEAEPEHVSAYALTIEEGTPLHTMVRSGRMPGVDPDVQGERHAVATEILGARGYERYEISNWARPGAACEHNLVYWSAGDYLGLGAGAHGHESGRRYWSVRLPRDFIERADEGASVEAGSETLGPDERAAEALMLGLRLASGVEVDAFELRFGDAALSRRASVVARLQDRGLLEARGGWLRIPPGAAIVANDVLCALL